MEQNRIHLLCTRNLDGQLVKKAEQENILIDDLSFILTKPLTADELTAFAGVFEKRDVVAVFTSTNAVQTISSLVKYKTTWKVFCTGGITKETVKKHFGEETIIGTARNASLLAEKIVLSGVSKQVIFFCGDQRLHELPEILHANDIKATEIICYRTIQTPLTIEKDYDGILFFSPSAVHSFFSMNTISTEVILFAIGNTTAAAIKTYCINTTIISEWPGAENLVSLAIKYFEKTMNGVKINH